MDRQDYGFDIPDGRESAGGWRGLLLLAVLLCGVFFLSVGAYGFFAADAAQEEPTGDLPGAVLALRQAVTENEAVAVFLGLSAPTDAPDTPSSPEDERRAEIERAAAEYIREHEA